MVMIKFWKEDIKYIKRRNYNENFSYHFSIRGESANYLINKYNLSLAFSNIAVHVYDNYNYIAITTYIEGKDFHAESEPTILNNEDTEELFSLLKEFIKQDQREWEEYKCNSDYYKRDSRWEK